MKVTPQLLKAFGFTYHKANDCYYLGDYQYQLSDKYRETMTVKDLVADLRRVAVAEGEDNVREGLKELLKL